MIMGLQNELGEPMTRHVVEIVGCRVSKDHLRAYVSTGIH